MMIAANNGISALLIAPLSTVATVLLPSITKPPPVSLLALPLVVVVTLARIKPFPLVVVDPAESPVVVVVLPATPTPLVAVPLAPIVPPEMIEAMVPVHAAPVGQQATFPA